MSKKIKPEVLEAAKGALDVIEKSERRLLEIIVERDDASGALPKAELSKRFALALNSFRATYAANDPVSEFGGPRFLADHLTGLSGPVPGLSIGQHRDSAEDALGILLALFSPEELSKRAEVFVSQLVYKEGLGEAARAERFRQLDAEKIAVLRAHRAAVETCAEAGVTISHHPENAAVIEAENRARELAERDAQRQAAGKQQLDKLAARG